MLQKHSMLKSEIKKILYLSVTSILRSKSMNSILTGNSNDLTASKTIQKKNDVETTGSLAMGTDFTPLFDVPVYNYDMFIPTNPFSLNIDFSSYSEEGRENLAANSSFMQGFYNAMSILSEGGMSFGSLGGNTTSAGVSSGCAAGSCSIGGGFTSVG